MNVPEVSVLIPNYKTPELTKICLRLIRKNTERGSVEVIVVDNDSRDQSTEYLRGLGWIRLIERPAVAGESGSQAHARALDAALARVTTPYVLSIHTDTFVHHPGWLEFLLGEIKKSPEIAGVGSWKLETKPLARRLVKHLEYALQSVLFPLMGKGYGNLQGKGDNFFYLRSHCALYRTDLIRKFDLGFAQGGQTAGKMMHRCLKRAGFKMVFLPAEILSRYVYHVNHATAVLNPHSGASRRTLSKGTKRIRETLDAVGAEAILAHDAWDA